MQLTQQAPAGRHAIRAVHADALEFESGRWDCSLYVGERQPPTAWRPRTIESVTAADLETLLACGAPLILLGTGARLVFPPAPLLHAVRARGIGLEVMDNRAAARTYNVLLGEGRDVLLACLLDGTRSPA